jgi:3-mercaptopyruvate sulfurtransferase SseA
MTIEHNKGGGSPSSTMPLALIAIGLVLILGLLLWQQLSVTSQPASPTASTALNSSLPYPNVARLNIMDARKAFDQKTAVFLDVRDADSFNAGHIPGAVNIPLSEFDTRFKELKTDQWIIAYCT